MMDHLVPGHDLRFDRPAPVSLPGWLRTASAALFVLALVLSVPAIGAYRFSRDAYWCQAFGEPVEQCVKERRAERWGPFKALGTNRKSSD